MQRAFKLLHYLHLDVVFGALSYQWYFLHLSGGAWHYKVSIALGAAVWLIYFLDRLIDAKQYSSLDKRHLFLKNNQGMLSFWALILTLLGLHFGMQLPSSYWTYVWFILGGIGIYWALWYRGFFLQRPLSKAFVTALFYWLGTGLAAGIEGLHLQRTWGLGMILFGITVLHHLWLFDGMERGKAAGKNAACRKLESCFVLFSLIALVLVGKETYVLLPILCTFAFQVWINYRGYRLSIRPWAEWVYWSPLLLLAYEFFSK